MRCCASWMSLVLVLTAPRPVESPSETRFTCRMHEDDQCGRVSWPPLCDVSGADLRLILGSGTPRYWFRFSEAAPETHYRVVQRTKDALGQRRHQPPSSRFYEKAELPTAVIAQPVFAVAQFLPFRGQLRGVFVSRAVFSVGKQNTRVSGDLPCTQNGVSPISAAVSPHFPVIWRNYPRPQKIQPG
jgi:hypothetical protein